MVSGGFACFACFDAFVASVFRMPPVHSEGCGGLEWRAVWRWMEWMKRVERQRGGRRQAADDMRRAARGGLAAGRRGPFASRSEAPSAHADSYCKVCSRCFVLFSRNSTHQQLSASRTRFAEPTPISTRCSTNRPICTAPCAVGVLYCFHGTLLVDNFRRIERDSLSQTP